MQDVQRTDTTAVRYWLYSIAILVAAMVLVGGATRLTDSGLSITQWKPISGIIPPLSAADWQVRFDLYRQTTEYQTVNAGMSLAQFQFIYWWEWAHRALGRLVGLAVLIPLIWFWAAGRLSAWMKPRALILFASICLQGAIGWWMVASGLVGRVDVSQIRLAVHLTMACAIFVFTLWLARSTLPERGVVDAGLSRWAGGLVALVLVQVFAGGLVAGLDAGMAYNSWPLMNGAWVPDGLLAISPAWQNFFDNAMMVQFVHRVSAYLLWFAALAHVAQCVAARSEAWKGAAVLAALVTAQALMGIITLLLQVPLSWALAHQSGAVIVLTAATFHWRALAPKDRAGARDETPVNAAYGST